MSTPPFDTAQDPFRLLQDTLAQWQAWAQPLMDQQQAAFQRQAEAFQAQANTFAQQQTESFAAQVGKRPATATNRLSARNDCPSVLPGFSCTGLSNELNSRVGSSNPGSARISGFPSQRCQSSGWIFGS